MPQSVRKQEGLLLQMLGKGSRCLPRPAVIFAIMIGVVGCPG